MHSELRDRRDITSIYQIVEFKEGVEFDNIANNSYLMRELQCLGIQYIAFFNSSREFIVNAIGCSDYNVLDEMIRSKGLEITDVPLEHPVKIFEIQELQDLLYVKLTKAI